MNLAGSCCGAVHGGGQCVVLYRCRAERSGVADDRPADGARIETKLTTFLSRPSQPRPPAVSLWIQGVMEDPRLMQTIQSFLPLGQKVSDFTFILGVYVGLYGEICDQRHH